MAKGILKAEFEALKSRTLNLSINQLIELSALIDNLKQGRHDVPLPDKFQRALYDAVWHKLERVIGADKPPLGVMYPKIGAPLRSATELVLAYLTKHLTSAPLRDNEFPSMARELIEVTIESMRQREIPLSCKTVLQQLQTIATTMDEALPGYSASGFIEPMFLRRPNQVAA